MRLRSPGNSALCSFVSTIAFVAVAAQLSEVPAHLSAALASTQLASPAEQQHLSIPEDNLLC